MEASVAERDATEETVEPVEAPVEGGAEATRSMGHLFEYSTYVNAGTDSEECEHAKDGKCKNDEHFHAWICLPNALQNRDIQEKARAAKARRKRALRDSGGDGRSASDAYVTLESELDDLLAGDRERLLAQIADRNVRKKLGEIVTDIRESDHFENYEQDAEEYRRLSAMKDEERDEEEYKALDDRMTEFTNAVEERVKRTTKEEIDGMGAMTEDQVRALVREARIEGEANEQSDHVYHVWLGFIGTRVCGPDRRRYFQSVEDFRNASPEAVNAIDLAMQDLTTRTIRGGGALGN
jgi:hypothetical protein